MPVILGAGLSLSQLSSFWVPPQNVIDTSEYDFAKERVNFLKAQYAEIQAQFEERKAAYDARGEDYQNLVVSYKEGGTTYAEVTAFHAGLEEERLSLNQQKDQFNALGQEIAKAIARVDQLYQELFVK